MLWMSPPRNERANCCPSKLGLVEREEAAVPQSHGNESAAFARCGRVQDAAMKIEHMDYSLLSEQAIAAADDAVTLEECQAHLARAVRYASLASLERQRSPDFNVVDIRQDACRTF
jgi:hypothetical protein